MNSRKIPCADPSGENQGFPQSHDTGNCSSRVVNVARPVSSSPLYVPMQHRDQCRIFDQHPIAVLGQTVPRHNLEAAELHPRREHVTSRPEDTPEPPEDESPGTSKLDSSIKKSQSSSDRRQRPCWLLPVIVIVVAVFVAGAAVVGVVVGTSRGASSEVQQVEQPDTTTNAPTLSQTKIPIENPTLAPSLLPVNRVTIVSDGTEKKPYCSWVNSCVGDKSEDEECALKLCQASGYSNGTFVSKSNDYCSSSFVDETVFIWFWSVDSDQYDTGSPTNEAEVTAECIGTSSPTPAPTPLPPVSGTIVISDGTETKPHCSWNSECVGDSSEDEECAQKLCEAAGFNKGTFLSRSNNYCTASFVSGTIWFWSVDNDQYDQRNVTNDAEITAECTEKNTQPPGTLVVSDGTESKPYCSWSNSCTGDSVEDQECALKLCEASGFTSGTFVSKSNDYCRTSFVSGILWYWSLDEEQYVQESYENDAEITAICF